MSKQIWFIADLHLGHKRILDFGQRPYKDLEDMHIKMVEEWNDTIRKNSDIVWILGDVSFQIEELKWLNMMNGEKRLILGNHDCFDYGVYKKYFKKVMHFQKAYHGMVLTHIPIHPGELQYRNWKWNVHGHIHKPEADIDDPRYFNANWDIVKRPVNLDYVREQLDKA